YSVTDFLTTTYRCPVDAVCKFEPFYVKAFPDKNFSITSTNTAHNTVSAEIIETVSQVPLSFDVYLTFTQSEKMDVNKYISLNKLTACAYTINEYQGSQAKCVALVRLVRHPNPVYESDSQHIVAVSRHTVRFVYYT
ncbi:hypothetical protein, partial [Klebsiella pneumoniae]|uniref:hypothetical protein n=1 Tax=Klebsiella pneumoniae TaxID=573 RepID=UPI0025A1CABC